MIAFSFSPWFSHLQFFHVIVITIATATTITKTPLKLKTNENRGKNPLDKS
jgi:hypothetical protein